MASQPLTSAPLPSSSPTIPPPQVESVRAAKWKFVSAFWLIQTLVLYLGFNPFIEGAGGMQPGAYSDPEYITVMLGWSLVLAAAQAVFLWPIRRPAQRLGPGVPLWCTAGVAGLAAGALVGALALTMVSLIWLLTDVELQAQAFWVIIATMVLSWIVATPLLGGFARRTRRETALARISAGLFLGTLVECVAIIPLDVMVRRKTDCYCAQGTFWALVICGSVGLFACGPAIFLPILSRRRKRWYAGHCDACGYDMAGTPTADRCPECGAGWRP